MLYNDPWELEIVFVMLFRPSPNDRLMWYPPLKSELRHLKAPKRARISEFRSWSPSVFGFVFGFGSWLLMGSFCTLSSTFMLYVKIKTVI